MIPITETETDVLEEELAVYEQNYRNYRKQMEFAADHVRQIKAELSRRQKKEDESRPRFFMA